MGNSGPKILVTGGAGYIGSHTVVELVNTGFVPVILDDFSNSNWSVISNLEKILGFKPEVLEGSVGDVGFLENVFSKHPDIVAVIHFAAFKAVGESVHEPLKYYENNVAGLIQLLRIVQQHKVSSFVFSSSCTVYGQPDHLPVDESAPFKKAESPYGKTKQIGEEILEDVCKANQGFNCISLRYFNPIGAHETALIGELPKGVPNNLLPYVTQTGAGIREKLSVFGNDYNTADGTCIRDFIHVVDLAKAHVKAIQRMLNTEHPVKGYEFFNIGTGRGNSVLEIVHAFEKISGLKLNYEISKRRSGDIEQIYADTKKANQVLNWKAEKSLEESVLTAWKWQQSLMK